MENPNIISWIIASLIVVFSGIFVWLYILSVRPAALERKIGPEAYAKCGRYRALSMLFMFLTLGGYIAYYFFPFDFIPSIIFNKYLYAVLIGLAIAIPSTYMVVRGMLSSGDEAVAPSIDTKMYSGIYEKIRHPQAWEALWWIAIAFLLNSPLLAVYSVLWLPLEYLMMRIEEKDLLLRFGTEYQDYMEETGMFLPKLKK